LLFLLSLQVFAQDRIEGDTSRHKFLPTGIRIGTDILAIGKSYYVNHYNTTRSFNGWEINVDADFYRRFYAAVDFGSWTSGYALGNGYYSTDGRYFRIGVDVNFLLKDPDRNMFFVGLRRGHSTFNDYTDFSFADPTYGQIDMHVGNNDAKSNWNELTTGLRVKVWKNVWLGATGRIKFGLTRKGQDNLLSYEVPGYGRTFKTSWYGLNYQVFFRIPVREDKKPESISLK